MTTRRTSTMLVGGLACLLAACVAETAPEGTTPGDEDQDEVGTSAAAATQASFATDDLSAICNLTHTCCGPQGLAINPTTCANLFTSFNGFQGELDGASVFNGDGVTYRNISANNCLNGIAAIGCGTISATSYRTTHQACMNVMTGTRAAGTACTNSVQCLSTNYCNRTTGRCAPLVALGQPCTSNDQCSYRGRGVGCDLYGTGTCIALLANGATCYSSAECSSGLCNGTCATTAPTVFDATNCAAFGGAATSTVTAIASGIAHSCAILGNGTVKCWGRNSAGGIGDGTTIQRSIPAPVVNLGGTAKAISAGDDHTCAILTNNTLRCWGRNGNGQLGDGTMTNRLTPVTINVGGTPTAIAAGNSSTCALLSNGTVRCWGSNSEGQLGDGTTTLRTSPVSVSNLGGTAVALAGGSNHICVRLSNNTMRCWGNNANGQLGDGTTTSRRTPVTVTGLGGTPTAISTGFGSTCAILSNGTLRCWGGNLNGQLGDGTTTNRRTPVTINVGGTPTAISRGSSNTCARLSNGTLKCWGYNGQGQLGDGTTTQRTSPVSVISLGGTGTAISTGGGHTCATVSGGTVRCWGENRVGSLGDGTTAAQRLTPVRLYL